MIYPACCTITARPTGRNSRHRIFRESLKSFNRAFVAAGDQATRAVLVNAFVWPVPSKLAVCFAGGPADLRPKIAAAMREWADLSAGNIAFVFNEAAATGFKECDGATRYQIRIGFVRGSGHWSQIGTLSESVFPGNSMTLDFDTNPLPDDKTVKGLTLHETRPALRLHHEHQSPASPVTGWNWDRILDAYSWPGNTREERDAAMRFNLQRLSDDVLTTGQHTYTFTAYDQASIMHYSFPSNMFLPGQDQCRVEERYELSAADKEAIKDAYARQRDPGERSRDIDKALSDPRLDSVRDLLTKQKQLYPDR